MKTHHLSFPHKNIFAKVSSQKSIKRKKQLYQDNEEYLSPPFPPGKAYLNTIDHFP